ncbi:MAG TPA: membrane protein insertase YidC [Candidatus Pelethenecus faecipullorum]|uniref:Membrane protein insertase YidC n=1 Tax=Candidatus Pelethenecus faecipullorum TaxID=2840900 RepID=A0A9D1GPM2_9MOLU|nr:membrane protein insertase YidC [Candidatus Pelethenecus faecipullorum]
MTQFIYKNKYKIALIAFLCFLLIALSSCRTDTNTWYNKPYVDGWGGYSQEFHFSDFWSGLWGWPVSILSWPIAWICSSIGKALGNSFFWGILFTTLIVRTVAWPIYSKQNSMSLKMTLMQPEMARIQRKYGVRKDPQSQQQMQLEMMKLYKKYKMNPLGCILPMFIQFPIFMAMYEVVKRINASSTVTEGGVTIVQYGTFALHNTKVFNFFELNTSFFEATAIQDKIFAVVLAVGFGGLTLLSQKLAAKKPKYLKEYNNSKSTNAQQEQQQKQMKMMNIIMTVMFVFMSLSSTSLALYWLIGAIYQLFQSFIGRKINERNYYKAQKKSSIV